MGQAVDADGVYIDTTRLGVLLTQAADAEAVASELEYAAGRFGVILSSPGLSRVYLDAGGAFGAVYNRSERCVGSTLYTVLADPVEANSTYPLTDAAAKGEGRFAFGHTPDRRVTRLMCNHYLDLETFRPVRHWPTETDVFACELTADRVHGLIDTFIARQKAVIGAFTRHVSPASMPISGGADSRLLVALSRDSWPQIDNFFVHRTNRYTGFDRKIAQTIARTVDLDLNVYDPSQNAALRKRPLYVSKILSRQALAMGLTGGSGPQSKQEVEVSEALPEGGIVMRGNVTDISKAVLWRGVGIRQFRRSRGARNDPEKSLKLMMLGDADPQQTQTLLGAVEGWSATLPGTAHIRLQDFSSLEHFRSHGQGALFYALNHNFYLTPSADRTMLKALITLPPPIRDNFLVNDLILEKLMPELIAIPYVRAQDNQARIDRPSLGEWLKTNREGGSAI